MSETIIITGGRGFVGHHLQAALQQTKPDATVVVWDRPEIDITQPETYRTSLAEHQPTWIIHLAGLAAVAESYKQPDLVQHVNVTGTRLILETMREVSPNTKMLAVSSADIYGAVANQDSGQPLAELSLDLAQPHSPYAQSKWAMEKMIVAEFNSVCIRVRPFPHIGPGQQLGFVTADFAAQIAKIELKKQQPTLKVGNLEAIRDFTDVRDVVQAYIALLDKGQAGEVYHVASGQGTKIKDLLDQLLKLATVPITVETDDAKLRPSDVPILIGDATKLKNATGWQPKITLEQSLQDILNDWRERVK